MYIADIEPVAGVSRGDSWTLTDIRREKKYQWVMILINLSLGKIIAIFKYYFKFYVGSIIYSIFDLQ